MFLKSYNKNDLIFYVLKMTMIQK